MITKVSHQIAVRGPADIILALSVSQTLHAPIPAPREPEPSSRAPRPAPRAPKPAPRAPELVVTQFPELMGLRTGPVRTHRRKVPLNRLTAVRA
ncbi:hypothetical protein [Streptomyces roseochromogenus]|uniref:Uncharacterized protein n=1 Tax=Streptomyces roseochromogenus subsp. oscitans DS 12.976 TaxID=1352936 RepID=V6KGQ9_STRRC|nr:hypothetical protein [Streptomyces roseochromogenus]EST28169.1 hypothetical protein M878_23275 [Streptomyces roseochromogenus subsp. oscitans DS 12.976]